VAESTPGLWACGVLGKVHGLRGELYLNLAPGGLDRLTLGERFFIAAPDLDAVLPCELTRVGGDDRRPLVRLDLAATREEAVALQGREVFAAGESLDEQPHYRVGDLLGQRVETASGRLIGTVSDVLTSPAHDILEIRPPAGAAVLVPLVDELVTFDDEARVLRVVDGLLDEERP
jgi:16S rRNA processing protein RimM